jgi:transitional endoplasmic reticulum ATPase
MHEEQDGIDARHDTGRHDSAAKSVSAYPHDVARVLSYLANLIDGSIALRGVGNDSHVFAARYLERPALELTSVTRDLGPLSFQLAGIAFADVLREHTPAAVIGEDLDEPPRWERLELGDRTLSVPYELSAAFAPGTLAGPPLVVTFETDYGDRLRVRAWARSPDTDPAGAWLDDLIARGRTSANPFRGRIIRASARPALWFSIDDITPTTRDDVVLDPGLWTEVDRSITSLLARRGTHPPPDCSLTATSISPPSSPATLSVVTATLRT